MRGITIYKTAVDIVDHPLSIVIFIISIACKCRVET